MHSKSLRPGFRPTPFLAFYTALVAPFLLQSCLTGGGDTESPMPPESALAAAERLYNEGKCGEAMTAFEGILAGDSTSSLAYKGYARSTLCLYGLDTAEIFPEMRADSGAFLLFFPSLLNHPDSVLTHRLQGSLRTMRAVHRFMDRDSLTRYWMYLDDTVTAEEQADAHYAARRAMMQAYFAQADLGTPGYRPRAAFPLTDSRVTTPDLLPEYFLSEVIRISTRLIDLDLNDTIDHRDSLMKKLMFGSGGGGFSFDSLSSIVDDLEDDTAATRNLNDLISGMGNGDSSLCALLTGGCGSLDSAVVPPDSGSGGSENLDSVIASLGETILFYQFGDKLDNDGDGCVDEEILDEKDNDLDGFVDEDARVIPANKPDGVDNDRDGYQDPLNPPSPHLAGNDSAGREAPVGIAVNPARPWLLGYVQAYLAAHDELALNGEATTWVKIKKDAPSEVMRIRFDIQKDSLAVRIPVGGPVPDSLKAKLVNAKADVGGCWRNYP